MKARLSSFGIILLICRWRAENFEEIASSIGPTSPSGIDMIAVIILSNRAGAPGVNDRGSTRDGSGLRTTSVRLTLIRISFVEDLFGGDETVGTITLRQSPAL
jgi:hypothetical protein